MENEKKIKKLKHLMYSTPCHLSILEMIEEKGEKVSYIFKFKQYKEIYILTKELKLDKVTIKEMWDEMNDKCFESRQEYSKKPIRERKDNKNTINYGSGSSGGYRNSTRFPSKKRNLYTWRNFYKLFPYWAEKDNFDGKTSDRMK